MIENILNFVKRNSIESPDILWDYLLSDLKQLREEFKKYPGIPEKEIKIIDEIIDDKEKRLKKEIETGECSNCGVDIKYDVVGEQEGLMYYEISFENDRVIKKAPRFSNYDSMVRMRCRNCQKLFDFSEQELLKIVSREK